MLFSGMYVAIQIPVQPPVALARIPTRALQPGGKVWIVRDGKLIIFDADVARTERETSLIRIFEYGPQPGDKVVTSPLSFVQDGMLVEEANER